MGDSGKSVKNALYMQYAKKTSQAEAILDSEKIKSIALAIVELHFSVTQSVGRLITL